MLLTILIIMCLFVFGKIAVDGNELRKSVIDRIDCFAGIFSSIHGGFHIRGDPQPVCEHEGCDDIILGFEIIVYSTDSDAAFFRDRSDGHGRISAAEKLPSCSFSYLFS